jgi:hypothetical protein
MVSLGNKTLLTWMANTKEGVGIYTKTWPFSWAFNHLDDVVYFQYVDEVNRIKVPFAIGIQTPSQLQSMVSLGGNGVISMDATFNTNDVNFHFSH